MSNGIKMKVVKEGSSAMQVHTYVLYTLKNILMMCTCKIKSKFCNDKKCQWTAQNRDGIPQYLKAAIVLSTYFLFQACCKISFKLVH